MAGVENKNMVKAVHEEGSSSSSNAVKGPASPFIPTSKLIAKLSSCLSREKIRSMKKIEKDLKERKITRQQMVDCMRKVLNDDALLISTIRAYNEERMVASAMKNNVE